MRHFSILSIIIFANIFFSTNGNALTKDGKAIDGAAIAEAQKIINFSPNNKVDLFNNGSIHYGSIAIPGGEKPAIFYNIQSEILSENTYVVIAKLENTVSTWNSARSTCKNLGKGWDLPAFERRFQIFSASQIVESAGIVVDPFDYKNQVYGFWMRTYSESENSKYLEDKGNAYVLTIPDKKGNLLQPNFIPLQITTDVPYSKESGGRTWLDGFFFVDDNGKAKDDAFLGAQNSATSISLMFNLTLSIMRVLVNDDSFPIEERRNVERYLDKYSSLNIRGGMQPFINRYLSSLSKTNIPEKQKTDEIQASIRDATEYIRNTVKNTNWWEAFNEKARLEWKSRSYISSQLPKIRNSLLNPNNPKLTLYCMLEVDKENPEQIANTKSSGKTFLGIPIDLPEAKPAFPPRNSSTNTEGTSGSQRQPHQMYWCAAENTKKWGSDTCSSWQ